MYLIHYKPFEDDYVGNLEVMNEGFTLLLLYHVINLQEDLVPDQFARDFVGTSFVVVVLLSIFCNFFFLIKTIVSN
jgi:hypothetical protein